MDTLSTTSWDEQALKVHNILQKKVQIYGQSDDDIPLELPRNVLPIFQSTKSLSAREHEITEVEDATTLLANIHKRIWTAEETIVAFCKRASIAHRLVNCLMDADFDAAIKRARELDAHLENTGELIGPLHGLPISIKDLTAVKGFCYTMGYVSWSNRISKEDANVVDTLRKAGAVLYVKTTMPQSGMCLETVSNLYGRTSNPFNTRLTAGGSSGGEGALIACRGSILGMGTDSGGSIRVPAAFNGLYSLKPTNRRISYKGNMNNSPGLGSGSAIGPMAHSLRDLKLIAKVLIDDEPWLRDATVVEKPWIDTIQGQTKTKFVIGLIEWDEVVMPHPPIQRALQISKAQIESAGHKVVLLKPFQHAYAYGLSSRLFARTGTRFIESELEASGEPPIEAISWKLGKRIQSAQEIIKTQKEWNEYKDAYLNWWMQTTKHTGTGHPVDGLLLPTCGSMSFPHNYVQPWNYVSIYNLLDYPCITLPITTVDKTVDVRDDKYVPANEADRKNHESYDPELYDAMPVCLQVVGQPLGEERLLNLAGAIDDAIRASRD